MRTAQIAELKEHLTEVLDAVRKGETVALFDGATAVAELMPVSQQQSEPLPADFFTRPLPTAKASVVAQLLEDRRDGR